MARSASSPFLTLTVIGAAIEAACYFASASIHITDWTAQGMQAVALLPPARSLLTGAIVFAAVIGAAFVFGRRARPASSRQETAAWVADALRPLLLLLLLALPYVPHVVNGVPAVMVLAGPVKWIVIVAAVAGCASRTGLEPAFSRAASNVARPHVFLVSLVIYLALGIPFSRVEGPDGDEPHYLVLAHSLLVDRDIQIENNHRLRHYDAFAVGDLPMHYLHRGVGGVIYSVHSAGLPAILLPGYAVAGYAGAVVTIALLAALVALAVYDIALLVGDRISAVLTWLAAAFTVPLAPHAWLIFPELPAALISAWAALWIWKSDSPGTLTWIARGAALSVWPWLHVKFLGLLLVAAALLVFTRRSRRRDAVALVAPIAVSAGLWLFSFWVMYGVASPFAQYGAASQRDMSLGNVPRGLFGLLFDYKFGVLLYSPIYLAAIVGAFRLLRDRATRWNAAALCSLVLTLLASVTPYTMWWGGRSAPARFIVPAIPFLVPLLASGIETLRATRSRALVGAALAWSVGLFGLMALRPDLDLIFNDRQIAGRLVTFLQGEAPISSVLPSFAQATYGFEILKLAVWTLAIAVAIIASRAVVTIALLLLTTAGLGAVTLTADDRSQIATSGRERLMAQYDDGAVALAYPSLSRLSSDVVIGRAVLVTELPDFSSRPGNRLVLAGPFALPPGRFAARVWLRDGGREYDGAITLTDRPDRSLIATRTGPFRSPLDVPFLLPIGDRGLSVMASAGQLAAEVTRVEIVPHALLSRSRRPDDAAGALFRIPSREGAYLIYVDDSVFPEPDFFWTKGGMPGRVAIAPAGARRLRVSVTAGPMNTGVEAQIASRREMLQLGPGETRVLERELDPEVTTVPLTITAAEGFRPASVDPQARDQRYLGCRVSVTVFDR